MKTKLVLANPSPNRSPRHRSREFALQGIYEWLLNKSDATTIIAHISEAHGFDKADITHFKSLVAGIIAQVDTLRAEILPFIIGRSMDELSPVEHASLLLGTYELVNHIDIPYRVVINETVELTKSFGTTGGHKFVNGILDKIAAKKRQEEVKADQRHAQPAASDSVKTENLNG